MSNLQTREISVEAIRADTVLTGAYVAATEFSMAQDNFLSILVDFTKGDETTLEMKIEASPDGTTFGRQVGEATTGGTTTVTLNERAFGATGIYSVEVYPIRAKTVKVSVKATGGTPTGTVALTAVHSWA